MNQVHSPTSNSLRSWAVPMPEKLFLVLILLAELWIFSGAFQKFFTLDSLFYMTNVPRSWGEFQPYLVTPSAEKSYRPLNLGLVALVRPFLGVDPYPYHWIPIIFHLLNTWLFYALAKRIFANSTAGLAAAAFWGLHSVSGWVTYDITYLSDFLLAFLLLLSLLLAVAGAQRKSRLLIVASAIVFVLSLMTKEAATTFPLAFWICLSLADLRASGEPATLKNILQSFRKTLPLTSLYVIIACAFAGLFLYWTLTGNLYTQGPSSAYDINLWANLPAKIKYFYWGLNLPDALSIPNAEEIRTLAITFMGGLLLIWIWDILRRRGRLSVVEWAGILWFIGLNVPAFLLSHRLAKWYLYIPLLGLALAFGVLVENLCNLLSRRTQRIGGLVLIVLLIGPFMFSSLVQTRSYLVSSDSAYQSDLLQSCLSDFQKAHPTLPPQATLYFLPAFEEGVSNLLSAPPIDRGGLFGLYYPGTRLQALFAHLGHALPADIGTRSDVIVLQYLDRHLHDVTSYFKSSGKMTLYVLPTSEAEVAPLLKKTPAGGNQLYGQYVQMLLADAGAQLPEDYLSRKDIWMLQYIDGHFDDVTRYLINGTEGTMFVLPILEGRAPRLRLLENDPGIAARLSQSHVRILSLEDLARILKDYASRPDIYFVQFLGGVFTDITGYYKGRHAADALRVVRNLEGVQVSVNRAEYYPNYRRFDTPTGAPAFFPTPEKEVLTQIGGSTVIIPLHKVPRDSRLCFDVSWMYGQGDGGWAEAGIRAGGKETLVYREYLKGKPKATSLDWKPVSLDLKDIQDAEAELVLRCYNDPGKNTIADWLNWRDIAIQAKAPPPKGAK